MPTEYRAYITKIRDLKQSIIDIFGFANSEYKINILNLNYYQIFLIEKR